jgi:hypothetical protein
MSLQIFQTSQNSVDAVSETGVLMRNLIDYAGLFPPASLGIAPSIANYDVYSRSEWSWILGRFIVPATRLDEFEAAIAELPTPITGTDFVNWRLSALLGSDPAADTARIREFNARMTNFAPRRMAVVESVEVKVASPAEIIRLSEIIPAELAAYFEFPLSSCTEFIAAVAKCGRKAKIRMGGETADNFPAPEGVIKFLRRCAASNVPFKATAGLHHPLRSVHRFTYEPDSAAGTMHGFLNVFMAALFLRAGMKAELAAEVLEEESAQAFQFEFGGVSWREHQLSRHQIADARRDFAVSFGSCSFTEPVNDLRTMHLL